MEGHRDRRSTRDLVLSELLVITTPLLIGGALILVLQVSWKLFPILLVAMLPFGLGCLGLDRYRRWKRGLSDPA